MGGIFISQYNDQSTLRPNMVRIEEVYTGGGDKGDTSLLDGSRVKKNHSRINLAGMVDGVNSQIGFARMEGERLPLNHQDGGRAANVAEVRLELDSVLGLVQHELFDIGAEFVMPSGGDLNSLPVVREDSLNRLLEEMRGWQKSLEPLTSFILPTGCPPVAAIHVARSSVRELERKVVDLMETEEDSIRPLLLRYLNILSDWLFVLSRWVTMQLGGKEAVWVTPNKRENVSITPSLNLDELDEVVRDM